MYEIFHLISSMSPFLLLGFFLAGLMHAFVPSTFYRRYLGTRGFRSVLNAVILGFPMPLCSCGVIPTAMSLRKEGASKGAAVSFLIVTPQTGVDSIIATYSLMGLPFALLRPLVALLTSLIGGTLVSRYDTDSDVTEVTSSAVNAAPAAFPDKMKKAFRYAFVEMMQDIGKWLVVGLIIAGVITVVVPDSWFSLIADRPLISMLLVLLLAIPMYLCTTGSIPIAMALLLKGLSPGTALVMLVAGPAVNLASMIVVGKVMGRRVLGLYLLTIVGCAIGFGLATDYLLPREWFTAPLEDFHSCHDCGISWINIVSTVMLAALLLNAFVQRYSHRHHHHHCGCSSCSCEPADDAPVWAFTVKGMTCNHCKSNVEKVILSETGVERVAIDLVTGQVRVYGNPDREKVVQNIKSIGFEVVL